jgi:hypothetical protein
MLTTLHTTIQTLLHDRGQIPADEVEITFERPTRDWVEARVRPTINLFLFDLVENTDLRRTDMQTYRGNGDAAQRMPPRRLDLRYLVSALTTVAADEHLLLWRTLATLLHYPQIPAELLPDEVRAPGVPIGAQVGKMEDAPRVLDLWSALETPLRPALLYTVTAPLDLAIEFRAPLVLTRTLRATRSAPEDERHGVGMVPSRSVPVTSTTSIGGVVRDRQGQPVADLTVAVEGSATQSITSDDGRFRLSHVAPGPLRLRVSQADRVLTTAIVEVPADTYDLEVDV